MRTRLFVITFLLFGLWKTSGQGYLQPIAVISTNLDLKALYEEFHLPIVIIGTTAYVPSDGCQCNESRNIGGDTENREVAGNTDQRQIGGDTENRQIAGNTDQRQIGGDTENREVAGNTDQRQVGGDTEDRKIAGDTDQRQLGGDISRIPCIKLDDCSGFKILSTNTLEISVFNGSTNQPLTGNVVLFNDEK